MMEQEIVRVDQETQSPIEQEMDRAGDGRDIKFLVVLCK